MPHFYACQLTSQSIYELCVASDPRSHLRCFHGGCEGNKKGLCWASRASAAAELDVGPESPSVFFFVVFFFFFSFFYSFLLPINRGKEEKVEEKKEMSPGLRAAPDMVLSPSLPEKSVKGSNVLQHQQKVKDLPGGSHGWAGNFLLMAELRTKIMSFRDVLDLPPCNGSIPLNELLMHTVRDLHKLYPTFVSCPVTSKMMSTSPYQGLHHFYDALGSVEDSWSKTHNRCGKFSTEKDIIAEEQSFEELGKMVLEKLGYMSEAANEVFDLTDEEDEKSTCSAEDVPDFTSRDLLKDAHSANKAAYCESPHTPTSVLPDANIYSLNIGEFPTVSYPTALLLPLRLKAMGKLKPIDVKRLSFHMLPHVSFQNFTLENRINKTFNALEPSNYEGSSNSKALPVNLTTASAGGSGENKAQGMADALAEITKRSSYFRQIEEDVEKHAKSIMEMKSAINSFQTKDMTELLKFHQYVELHLEDLTDETQVLSRFEDFPTKKLEMFRSAAALYSKLDGIATNLESWKIEVPLARQLEKVECYFNKIKLEVDAIERTKDEEAKRFQSHKIEFDFSVLFRIKEFMVDVSSNCIEMALKESKETKEDAAREGGTKHDARLKACSKTLWTAFQLAFRVYNFAGGQDDRADKLTSELAQEIETYANYF
ncbi:hypothetical protein AAC387_Pa04g1837 [Persea americana]